MTSIGGSSSLLEEALRDLLEAWQSSEDGWRDVARERFREQHLDGIQDEAEAAVKAMRQLELLVKEAVRQCQST